MASYSIYVNDRWRRSIIFDTILRIVTRAFPAVYAPRVYGRFLTSQPCVWRRSGVTYYITFDDQIDALLAAEVASASGALRNDIFVNQRSELITAYATKAAGTGAGNWETTPPVQVSTNPHSLVLTLGHSIAAARYAIAGYSAPLRSAQANTLGAWSTSDGTPYNSEALRWLPVQPYQMSAGNTTDYGSSTLAMVNSLLTTYPGGVASINVSYGGTSMAAHWQTGASNNAMWLATSDYVTRMLAVCPVPITWRGALIHLGENDATVQANADAWQGRMLSLIDAVRTLSGVANLPIALAPIDPTSAQAYKATINTACTNIAALRTKVTVLDATGWLTGSPDTIHPSEAKLEQIGAQAASAIVAMQ